MSQFPDNLIWMTENIIQLLEKSSFFLIPWGVMSDSGMP